MENEKKEKKEVKIKKESKPKMLKIKPTRDHIIKQNAFYYELKKGVEIEIDASFEQTLKTEKLTR